MKRWHILVPDAVAAKEVYDDLVAKGFEATNIHVFAKDKKELQHAGVPPASEMEEAMVGGRSIGTLISGIFGAPPPDRFVREAERDIEAGQILFVIGFPDDKMDTLREIITAHPAARSPEVNA
jgi:hypothetical protein